MPRVVLQRVWCTLFASFVLAIVALGCGSSPGSDGSQQSPAPQLVLQDPLSIQGVGNCGTGQVKCAGTCVVACNNNCSYPCNNGICSGNTCTCPAGQSLCNGTCVNEQTDSNNCGSCGNSCGSFQTCTSGICCTTGDTACSGSCVNTSASNSNCGSCGHVCATGTACSWGVCCATGQTSCGGVCTNENTDTNNCGACGNSCAQPSSGTGYPTCSGGTCGITCQSPTTSLCSGACVDKQTDNNNCGACGNVCGAFKSCSSGVCCAIGQTSCGGVCTNENTDPNNCGSCGHVCPGPTVSGTGAATCLFGSCGLLCSLSTPINCGGSCVNTLTDNNNCGGCGKVCAAGTSCNLGVCGLWCSGATPTKCGSTCVNTNSDNNNCGACGNVCGSGQSCCSGVCVNESTDKNNCGACGNACASSNAVCSSGTCSCATATNSYCSVTGCTNLQTDTNNCGACGYGGCGTCNSGACCNNGGNNCHCGSGLTLCSGNSCKNLLTDANNCGACGNKCASGQPCVNGVCQGCGAGLTVCTGACSNLNTDPKNCGACGNACPNGDSCCSGVCSDTSSDNANCGGCGVLCTNTVCDNSLCCASGLGNCSNMCIDTTSNNSNCGACGLSCPAGQSCSNSACSSGSGSDAGTDGGSGSAGDAGEGGTGGGNADGGSFGAPICANDPCNPYCTEFDQPAADLTPDAMTGTTTTTVTTTTVAYQGSANGFGGTPAGFHAKEVNTSGCVTNGVPDYSQCNTDYHCDTSSGKCVRSQPGWSYPASVCSGINLTISGACTDAYGNTTMPLCNRGNTTLRASDYPQGISYYEVNGNQFDFNCPTYTPPSGYLTLTQDLAPGQCINVWPGGVHGNTIMYINADHSVPECGAFGGSSNAPGCYDNWADVKTGGSCQPQTQTTQTTATVPAYSTTVYTAQATASCPSGTSAQWSVFTYDLTVPTNSSGTSSVLIQARTAPVSPVDGGVGTYSSWATFANTAAPTNDPAVCPYTGGSGGCPKDAFALLGGLPTAGNGSLQLQITLTPTPDGQAIPVLIGWQVAYSCKPSE